MKSYILESCVDSVESAISATNGGANRLELCGNLMIGGTTPTKALFQEVRKNCKNRIHVLIRPRFGDFCYSGYEYNIIREEVKLFRELGADGVVIGILEPTGDLDMVRMQELVKLAGDMSITLHRAFDVCRDPFVALEQSKQLGIHSILTSGQKNVCLEGKECLKELIVKSDGKVDILIGSGVKSGNIKELYEYTRSTSFHMSGKIVKDSLMAYRKEGVHMGLDSISEYDVWQTSEAEVKKAVQILDSL